MTTARIPHELPCRQPRIDKADGVLCALECIALCLQGVVAQLLVTKELIRSNGLAEVARTFCLRPPRGAND